MPTPRFSMRRGLPRCGARSLAGCWILIAAACTPVERAADPAESDPRAEAMADPDYRAAAEALAERRPWRAEALLAPVLADSTRRTAWVVLLAAEAAAANEQWALIDSLLGDSTFEDERAAAAAGLLLARSALEQDEEVRALAHARAVLALHPGRQRSAEALVFLARAHERMGARDSARIAYSGAAESLAPASDWLNLRAAALTRDSA